MKRQVATLTGRSNSSKEEKILHYLHEFFSHIEQYFSDLNKGYNSNSSEIIFDGPKYLLVDVGFFESYFVWRQGSWRIKEKYL